MKWPSFGKSKRNDRREEDCPLYAFEQTMLEGKQGEYEEFSRFFEAQGFELGGGWDYDHGYFDYKLASHPGYLFIRIPAYAERGTFGDADSTIRLGRPFLLRHKYQKGIAEDTDITLTNATFNQFAEPEDADASLTEEDLHQAKPILHKLEHAFQEQFGA